MIYLIITTSINNKHGVINHEHRKKLYIKNIKNTLEMLPANIKPIIVENNGYRETYLDNLGCDIIYTDNNNIKTKHKGINELLDIKYIISKYNINDNDIIIKLTGRYRPLNNKFFDICINNSYDAFLKFYNVCTKKFMKNDCVLGFFGIKCKYLKDFEYDCIKSAEVEFASFIRNNIDDEKILSINNLNLECCFADNLRILKV